MVSVYSSIPKIVLLLVLEKVPKGNLAWGRPGGGNFCHKSLSTVISPLHLWQSLPSLSWGCSPFNKSLKEVFPDPYALGLTVAFDSHGARWNRDNIRCHTSCLQACRAVRSKHPGLQSRCRINTNHISLNLPCMRMLLSLTVRGPPCLHPGILCLQKHRERGAGMGLHFLNLEKCSHWIGTYFLRFVWHSCCIMVSFMSHFFFFFHKAFSNCHQSHSFSSLLKKGISVD